MENTIILVGRLTRDPEFRQFTRGGESKELAKFRIAVDRPGTSGDTKKTDFFDVVTFYSAAFVRHLTKGRQVLVRGIMTTNEHQPEGSDRKVTYYEVQAERISALDRPNRESTEEVEVEAPAKPAANTAASGTNGRTQSQSRQAPAAAAASDEDCPY